MSIAPATRPWHLWLVGVFALLFNAIGVLDFVMNLAQGDTYLKSTGMTPEQMAHYHQMPGWMMVVWAVGVFGAFIASALLLMRRGLAGPVFWLSLLAFGISLLYTYVLTNGGAIMGKQMAITSAVIAALLLCFCAYATAMQRKGVLG